MEITELLLREDVRSFLKVTVAAFALLLVGIRYYRVIRTDEDAEVKVLHGYRSFAPAASQVVDRKNPRVELEIT